MVPKRVVMLAVLTVAGACGIRDKDFVAEVNGDGILRKQFEAEVERNLTRYQGSGGELPPIVQTRIRESVLRRMIDDKIIEQKAKDLGVRVTDEELDAKFKEYKERFRSQEDFDDHLERSGNTAENVRDDVKRNLLRDRVVEKLSGTVDVDDDELRRYYDDNLNRFTEQEQVKASRILIRVASNATPAEKKAAQREARDILVELKRGADFAALAKEKSKGPEAVNGGDLGFIPRGLMTPELDLAAFGSPPRPSTPVPAGTKPVQSAAPARGLEVGEMSDVVETALGYEIIKVTEKKPERVRPFDEAKEDIRTSVMSRKRTNARRDVLRAIKTEAKIEQLVKFDPPPAPAGMPPPGAEKQ